MKVRLWLFTRRDGDYPEGGTYDTSVLDTTTGNCSDPHQEIQFQALQSYAIRNGEELQEVRSAQEAYSLCSRVRASIAPTNTTPQPPPSPGYTGSFQGGALEHAMYQPTNTKICGCDCNGGGPQTSPPPQQYYNQGTPADKTARLIALGRSKPGTIVY